MELDAHEYEEITRTVGAILCSHGASRDQARELMQEAFTRLAARPEPPQSICGFILVVAKNLLIDQKRMHRYREGCWITVEALYGEQCESRDPCRILAAEELLADLRAWAETLPAQRRDTWWSVRVLGERQQPIAERHSVTLKAIEKSLERSDRGVTTAPDYRDWHCQAISEAPWVSVVERENDESETLE